MHDPATYFGHVRVIEALLKEALWGAGWVVVREVQLKADNAFLDLSGACFFRLKRDPALPFAELRETLRVKHQGSFEPAWELSARFPLFDQV